MSDRITIRMPAELIEQLDEWIAAQGDYVSRQETIRRFIVQGLNASSADDRLMRRQLNR